MRINEEIQTTEVIKQILGRNLEYFDYKARDKNYWQRYFGDSSLISDSEVFKNEVGGYIQDLTKFCATMDGYPPTQEKLQILTNVQFGIIVLEDFVKRLKSIEDPNSNNVSVETISDAI